MWNVQCPVLLLPCLCNFCQSGVCLTRSRVRRVVHMCLQTVLRYGVPDLEFRLQFTDWPQMKVRSALVVAGTCCCCL